MPKKYLIVGGVAGGASAAARLRRLDERAQIILFERGEYISYANCGLPYHVGGAIPSRQSLLLQTPEAMKARHNIDVRVREEVVSIDRAHKRVVVRRADGEEYAETYDKLVLATGSSPVRPAIPGIDCARVLPLWTVPDADRLRALIAGQKARSAVVVGGGFIGLEAAENLRHAGLEVTLVEMAAQVMPPLDGEMALLLHEELARAGVSLHLGQGVTAFAEVPAGLSLHLSDGTRLQADFAVLAIGVRPNGELARAAGLEVNARGGIVVDDHLRTSDPDIYAAGDVIEVTHVVDGSRTMIPLAGPANKQGRIAANNIAGGDDVYAGSLGASVLKLFDLTCAAVGLNERALLRAGQVRGQDYDSVILVQNDHASYYPGARPMTIKLLFAREGGRVLGAQLVGAAGVDKRADVLATAIRLGASVEDLTDLELTYAPPYSSAKDPVNMAGFVAQNLLAGQVAFAPWDALETMPEATVLDVREDAERLAYRLPRSADIPLGQLRARLHELNRARPVIVFCAVGVRAHSAARILSQHGFAQALIYPGGTRFYRATHFQAEAIAAPGAPPPTAPVADSGDVGRALPAASAHLDCRGLQCPGPLMKVFEQMQVMREGEVMEVSASDPGFARDIGAWSERTGNQLLSVAAHGPDTVALVRKGAPAAQAPAQIAAVPTAAGAQGKTIVVFGGELDRVIAALVIANGAAAMGRPVTLFFTFWGLNALRRPRARAVRKPFIERIFGLMMPKGAGRMKLSRLNMLGAGTALMKKVMREKNVASVEELLASAQKAGVRLVACTMSMDVMGIRREELLEGVEYAGVGSYLGDAEGANVNLFV